MNELRIYPDPVLRGKAKKVENFDSQRIEYITNIMENIIKEYKAIGLAAPQIGILEQIIVIDSGTEYIKLINPELIETKDKEVLEEGCLCLPDIEIAIERAKFVVVKGIDQYGEKKIIEANDLVARALQHEIEHLNGILIIDKLPPVERVKFDMEWKGGEYEKRNPSRVL
jgi:peptide deformylase